MTDSAILHKLKKIGVSLEYKTDGGFPEFCSRHRGEKIALLCDRNTLPFAEALEIAEKKSAFSTKTSPFPTKRRAKKPSLRRKGAITFWRWEAVR